MTLWFPLFLSRMSEKQVLKKENVNVIICRSLFRDLCCDARFVVRLIACSACSISELRCLSRSFRLGDGRNRTAAMVRYAHKNNCLEPKGSSMPSRAK